MTPGPKQPIRTTVNTRDTVDIYEAVFSADSVVHLQTQPCFLQHAIIFSLGPVCFVVVVVVLTKPE